MIDGILNRYEKQIFTDAIDETGFDHFFHNGTTRIHEAHSYPFRFQVRFLHIVQYVQRRRIDVRHGTQFQYQIFDVRLFLVREWFAFVIFTVVRVHGDDVNNGNTVLFVVVGIFA